MKNTWKLLKRIMTIGTVVVLLFGLTPAGKNAYDAIGVKEQVRAASTVSFDASTGILTLYGNVKKADVQLYAENDSVKKIVAAQGCVFPEDCYMLFSNMKAHTIDLSKADTSFVKSMNGMFYDCHQLKNLNITGMDTSHVTDFSAMFSYCSSLESLDVSGFDTSMAKNMNHMFLSCSKLTYLDMRGFDTSCVKDMEGMFMCCKSLKTINVSSFDTSKVRSVWEMFYEDLEVETIYASSAWTMDGIVTPENGQNMFSFCHKLVGGNGTAFDSKHNDFYYARIDAPDAPGYFATGAVPVIKADLEDSYDIDVNDGSASVTLEARMSKETDYAWYVYDENGRHSFEEAQSLGWFQATETNVTSTWGPHRRSVTLTNVSKEMVGKYVGLDAVNSWGTARTKRAVISRPSDCCVFNAQSGILRLRGNVRLSEVKKFRNIYDLNVVVAEEGSIFPESCYGMFEGFLAVEMDLSNADTSQVTDVSCMFSGCIYLRALDLSGFDMSKVTNAFGMFMDCRALPSLDLRGFNTYNCQDMQCMFIRCYSLTSLDLRGFETSGVTKMVNMFGDCYELTSLDLTSFDTANVLFMSGMFSGCRAMTEVDLSSFNVSKVRETNKMFQGANALTTIYVSPDFKTDNVTNSANMFAGCAQLAGGNGTTYDENFLDKTYARIDTDGVKGYFTLAPQYQAERMISKFSFELEGFDVLENLYREASVFGKDVRAFPVKVPEGAHYEGTLQVIYNGKEINKTQPVSPGMTLTFCITPVMEEGYYVGREYSATINGSVAMRIKPSTGIRYFALEYKIPMPENGIMIEKISREVEVPVAGAVPATELVPLPLNQERLLKYTVENVFWYPETTSFEDGKDYWVIVEYKAFPDYGFYEDSEFLINGEKATVIQRQSGKRGTVRIMKQFSLAEPAKITKQPVDWYGEYGKKASFSVEAQGDGLTYRWQYQKSGQWNDYQITTYDTPNFKVTMNEKNVKWPIRCLITDSHGNELVTNEVWMKLLSEKPEPIVITKQPEDWYGQYGKKASFSVEATGNELTYQWQYKKSGSWIDYGLTTADTPNFSVTMNEKNVKWPIRCLLRDAEGNELASNEVWLKLKKEDPTIVEEPIVITKQPVDWYGAIGKKAAFDVEATGEGLSYQWQYNKGSAWADYEIATADTPSFRVTMNEKNAKWTYRCVITDVKGNTAITNEVHMKLKGEIPVGDVPVINSQPADWYGKYGQKAGFNVSATGNGLTYQWQYKKGTVWVNYAIATSDTANFRVTMNEKNVKWTFRCVITDTNGKSVTTNEVRMILAE